MEQPGIKKHGGSEAGGFAALPLRSLRRCGEKKLIINNGTAGIQNHGGVEARGFAAVRKLEKMKITSRLLRVLCELCGEQTPAYFKFPYCSEFS